MEALLKILYFLCLASATLSLQLVPSLNINSPVLDLAFAGKNYKNIQNNDNSISNSPIAQSKKCFCIPTNTNSLPVTNNMDPHDTQRLVIYLYKNKGHLKIYVPNKNKQKVLPELNFDGNEGDILKPVSSESLVDIFDSEIVRPLENIVPISEDVVKETETLITENEIVEPNMKPVKLLKPGDKPAYIPLNEENEYIVSSNDNPSDKPLDKNNEHLSLSTNENTFVEEDISIEEEDLSVDHISQPSRETQNEANNYADQTSQSIFAPQSRPERINNLDIVIDNQDVDAITNLEDSDQQQSIITTTNSQLFGNPEENNKIKLDKINKLDNYENIQQIFSPYKTQSYSEPLLQQDQYSIKLLSNPYITFYDWFNMQLNRVVIHNIETQSQVSQLREKIKKILQDNGMIISAKGIVMDSNRNLVRMNNLKLRPILIGSTIDAQNFSYQPNLPQTGIKYVQLIELILVSPPKLLGTLVLGTVYLPRNIQGEQSLSLDSNQREYIEKKYGWFRKQGCTSCKSNPASGSSYRGLKYSAVTVPDAGAQGVHVSGVRVPAVRVPAVPISAVPVRTETVPYSSYGPYYALPFRRRILKNGLPYKGPVSANVDRYSHNNNMISTGRAGILDSVLGSIGPILFANPSRRLLGGRLPQGPKPGPKSYPNDDFPGFRIIGGNAATSSGTPLANKGRSGFEEPSHII